MKGLKECSSNHCSQLFYLDLITTLFLSSFPIKYHVNLISSSFEAFPIFLTVFPLMSVSLPRVPYSVACRNPECGLLQFKLFPPTAIVSLINCLLSPPSVQPFSEALYAIGRCVLIAIGFIVGLPQARRDSLVCHELVTLLAAPLTSSQARQ